MRSGKQGRTLQAPGIEVGRTDVITAQGPRDPGDEDEVSAYVLSIFLRSIFCIFYEFTNALFF